MPSTASTGSATSVPRPGLLLIWKPRELNCDDRATLAQRLLVGRSTTCDWRLNERRISRTHFSLAPAGERFLLRDEGSRNGVFADGRKIDGPVEVDLGTLLRAGGCVFQICRDLNLVAPPGEGNDEKLAGRYHAASIIHALRVAARTGRHVLLEGESGSGKELAAAKLHRVLSELGRRGELLPINAALYAGPDDAVAALFGVQRGAFSGVEARTGALELSDGGTLFLDEVHNLPLRVQRSLLRFAEDGELQLLGQSKRTRNTDVRLVLGTNVNVQQAIDDGLLAHDLVARMHRVTIPPLRERRADIPSIFLRILQRTLEKAVCDDVVRGLDSDIVERLCLHDFRRGNVRELQDLAALIGARIHEGEEIAHVLRSSVEDAVGGVERTEHVPGRDEPARSVYERHRGKIISTYHKVDGNVSKLEATLRDQGIPCTRRWLAEFLDRWGVRSVRRKNQG